MSLEMTLSFDQIIHAVIKAVIVGEAAHADTRQLEHVDHCRVIRKQQWLPHCSGIGREQRAFEIDEQEIKSPECRTQGLERISYIQVVFFRVPCCFAAQHQITGQTESNRDPRLHSVLNTRRRAA